MIKIEKQKVLIKPSDLKPSSKKMEIIGTLNPAAIRLENGDILLYIRVIERLIKTRDSRYFYSPRMTGKEKFKLKIDKFKKNLVEDYTDLDFFFKDGTKRITFISHFRRVVLDKEGFKIKSIEQKPGFYGLGWDGELGVEDPRIVKINNLYVMTYVAPSIHENFSTSYAISNDCFNWYRRGIIFPQANKDVVLFPEIINNKYIAINRPGTSFEFTPPHLWISYSDDLEAWEDSKSFNISSKKEWDSGKIGAGPPPVKTEKGWLFIYHGLIEKTKAKKHDFSYKIRRFFGRDEGEEKKIFYCAGVALLDLKNPRKIIAKSKNPFLVPHEKYEKGKFEDKDVVFPTGLVVDKDKKHFLIYSGGGDIITSVKKVAISDLMKYLKN
jgi:predicted GH43/DUF377 family glycosyl hydrolase